jgi:heat shock protein 4
MMSAMLSPLFRVAEYAIEEMNFYPIKCQWTFGSAEKMEIEDGNQGKAVILFDKGCSIPNLKSLTFNQDKAIDFKLFYDPVPQGALALLNHTIIPAPKVTGKDGFSIKVRVRLNNNGIIGVQEVQLNEDYFEDVVVDKKVVKKEETKVEKKEDK